MKIKTKLTLLIGGGMMVLSFIFLITGTIFAVHEVLLVKRHELKIASRQIDLLMKKRNSFGTKSMHEKILLGIRFSGKETELQAAVFTKDKKKFYSTIADKNLTTLQLHYFPKKVDSHTQYVHWINWNHWRIDFYYRGEASLIQMRLIQQLEIQEDISTFFFGSLVISIILSLIGGRIITSRILKRAHKIENAAAKIASGELSTRIPLSPVEDEIRFIEQNLNTAFSELESSFQNIMEFSSDIAHELRTPLTIISGEIEVALREERTKEEYQTLMVNILEEISLLRRIINDMLILVKPESAYLETFEEIDISEIIKDIISISRLQAETKNISISDDIEDNILVSGVGSLITLTFSNLIYNAVKYTPENGSIKITLKHEGGKVIFRVANSGPGIPEEEREKVFTRFYRINSSEARGSGLGLAIVKKVCSIHRAEISLFSEPGKETVFSVQFPAVSKKQKEQ